MYDDFTIRQIVGLSVFTVIAVLIVSLIARDLIRDRRKRKQRPTNPSAPRGPWYPRILPLTHLMASLGSRFEDGPGYGARDAPGGAFTLLLFFLFIAAVVAVVWLFL
ncbi:MAG: hypothetical protein ACRD4D_06370 [Candidatus Acidiferrales bacterium]